MSSFPSNSSREIHLLETFRPSMDYARFEADIINPYIRTARARINLLASSKLPLSFAPGRKSVSELCNFLIDTDYNRSSHIIHVPSCNFKPKMSAMIPFDRSFQLGGYFSPKHPDCFVWEGGIFEEGSTVFFGKSTVYYHRFSQRVTFHTHKESPPILIQLTSQFFPTIMDLICTYILNIDAIGQEDEVQ